MLVVDDEPGIVDVLSMALRHHGFGVQSTDNGQDALERVRRWRPHVMVLDVMLPDMEGFEVARRLAAEHAAVPILFLSARDTTADKIRGLTTGGDDYVTKPFSLEELLARLRNILRRTGALADSRSRLRFADPRARRGHARGVPSRSSNRADSDRVSAAALPDAQPAPCAHACPAARPCLELRLRRRCTSAGDLHQLPAQEGRRRRDAAASDRAWRRIALWRLPAVVEP